MGGWGEPKGVIMSEMLKCDQCGKSVNQENAFGWLNVRLNHRTASHLTRDSGNGPWDYCSWGCAAAAGNEKVPLAT